MPAKNLKRKIGPGRLTAAEEAELPDRLLDAAFALFSKQGYSGTTIEQIAREAGASTKTIYSRYSSKGDILLAVARRMVERVVAAHGSDEPFGQEPRQYLVRLFTEICVRIATEAAGLNRLALSEGHRFKELGALHGAVIGRGSELVRVALVHWRDQGLLPKLDDPAKAAPLAMTMGTDRVRILTALGAPPTRAEIDDQVAYAVDFFLRGCGYGEAAEAKPRTGRASAGA